MLKGYQFWILTVAGVICLALVIANMVLVQTNHALQTDANSRGQYIQQSIQIETLYREIVQALADRAVRTQDAQVRDLLAAEGFNVNLDAPPGEATKR